MEKKTIENYKCGYNCSQAILKSCSHELEIDEEALRIKKLLKISVDELGLSVRSHNCLKAAEIRTIGDLVRKDEQEMLKFKNFGRKSLMELGKILEERGLKFGMSVEKYLKPEEKN